MCVSVYRCVCVCVNNICVCMCKYVCLQEPSYYPFCKISFFSWNINNNNTNLGQVTAHTFEKNVYLLHQSV